MKILTGTELQLTLAVAGYDAGAGWNAADRRYALPTRGFIEGAFSSALWSFQKFFSILNWSEEAMDCDDFARIAAGFAQILHCLTPGRPPATALAVGEIWYVRDSGEGHAINVALCGGGPDDVVCFEPQTRKVVELSVTEKARVTLIRF